jgi:hypothetical protein
VASEEDAIRRDEGRRDKAERLQAERWGDGEVVIQDVRLLDAAGDERAVFNHGDAVTVEIDYRVERAVKDLVFGVGLASANQVTCWGSNTEIDRAQLGDPPPLGTVRCQIQRLDLLQGTYFLDVAAHAKDGRAYDYIKRVLSFAMRSPVGDEGVFRPPHEWGLSGRGEG